jgi:SnoaL-like domain
MNNRDLDVKSIKDAMEITRVLYRGLRCTDEKKWDERVSYFSAELTIDFGEVKPLQTIKPHDLAAWARLAYASVKTQHMLFNVDVIVVVTLPLQILAGIPFTNAQTQTISGISMLVTNMGSCAPLRVGRCVVLR